MASLTTRNIVGEILGDTAGKQRSRRYASSTCDVCKNDHFLHDGVCVTSCPSGTIQRGIGRFGKSCLVTAKPPIVTMAPTVSPTSQTCGALNPQKVGDGLCDPVGSYNNKACGYDGGDCCATTCKKQDGSSCEADAFYSCIDPMVPKPAERISSPSLEDTGCQKECIKCNAGECITCGSDKFLLGTECVDSCPFLITRPKGSGPDGRFCEYLFD